MAGAWRLISVEVLPEARLRVRFVDGTAGGCRCRPSSRRPKSSGLCSSRCEILHSWRKLWQQSEPRWLALHQQGERPSPIWD